MFCRWKSKLTLIHSDEGLTLETSVFKSFMVANYRDVTFSINTTTLFLLAFYCFVLPSGNKNLLTIQT